MTHPSQDVRAGERDRKRTRKVRTHLTYPPQSSLCAITSLTHPTEDVLIHLNKTTLTSFRTLRHVHPKLTSESSDSVLDADMSTVEKIPHATRRQHPIALLRAFPILFPRITSPLPLPPCRVESVAVKELLRDSLSRSCWVRIKGSYICSAIRPSTSLGRLRSPTFPFIFPVLVLELEPIPY